MLVASYPTYPGTLATSFHTVLQQLLTQNGAVLYHCTAGKDRTGTFSALLLTMLGVPRNVVMDDYLLTNQFVATPARVDAIVARGGTRESAIATLGVNRAYLDLMFSYRQLRDVMAWGMVDSFSWLQSFSPRADGLPKRPNPFDSNYQRKLLHQAIAEAFAVAMPRT